MLHGSYEANCKKEYRRKTVGDGKRKRKKQPEDGP